MPDVQPLSRMQQSENRNVPGAHMDVAVMMSRGRAESFDHPKATHPWQVRGNKNSRLTLAQ